MKIVKMLSLVTLTSFLLFAGAFSCGENSGKTPENLGEIPGYIDETIKNQQDELSKQLETQLNDYDKSIADLKAQVEGLSGQAKDELNKKIELLETQKGDLNKQLEDLKKQAEDLKNLPGTAFEDFLKSIGLDGIYKDIRSIVDSFSQG